MPGAHEMCDTYMVCVEACILLQDPTPVVDRGPPKSITVEDSFKSCGTFVAAQHVLQVLAPDLLARMAEDFQVFAQHVGPRLTTSMVCTYNILAVSVACSLA